MHSTSKNFITTYKTPGFRPQQAYATESTFYTASPHTPHGLQTRSGTPRQSGFYNKSTATPKSSYFQSSSKLQDVQLRYERDVDNVNRKYEQHYADQYDLGSTVIQLEDQLKLERDRIFELEEQLNATLAGMQQTKRHKNDLERENRVLREKSRTNDNFINNTGIKMQSVQHTASTVSSENDALRAEVKRLSETCNIRIREAEDKLQAETRKHADQMEKMNTLIKDYELEAHTQVKMVTKELENKIRALENEIRKKDRAIQEVNAELKSDKEFVVKLKMEYEEEVKRRISAVKDEERAKYEPVLKEFEERLREIIVLKELAEQKIPDLIKEIEMKEIKARDVKVALEEQIRSLRKEILDLEEQVCISRSELQKVPGEIQARDNIIAKAQVEVAKLISENQRQKDIYIHEIDRLAARNEADQNMFKEFERQYRERLVDLERALKVSEEGRLRQKSEFEKVMHKVTGDVHSTISQTFVAYGVQGANGIEFY